MCQAHIRDAFYVAHMAPHPEVFATFLQMGPQISGVPQGQEPAKGIGEVLLRHAPD